MSKTAEENGIEVSAYLSPEDGVVVVHVDTPNIDEDGKGPLIRLYLNDDSVFENPPYPGVGTECKHVEDVVPVNGTATQYGEMAWTFGDVTSLEIWNDKDWTPAQAEEFLQQNAKHIRDRLIAVGFEVMEDLLATWTPEKANGESKGESGTEEPQAAG